MVQKQKVPHEVKPLDKPGIRAPRQSTTIGGPGCFFCEEPATIRVEGDPFCTEHGCGVLVQSFRNSFRRVALQRNTEWEEGWYERD